MQTLSENIIGIPLGLAVNEEGGNNNVVSLKHRIAGAFPSVQSIYKESGVDGVLKINQEKRELLRKFNLNINLAPVADISNNSKDYIYSRTLGQNADITADYIAKDIEGYIKDNFTCCVKHFPGYGNNKETKLDASIDNRKFDILYREDFVPFINAIDKGVPMIYFAHIISTCKDSIYPASFSKTWHDYLRDDLSFSGLILTEIYMENIYKYTKGKSPSVAAINAGNDIILTDDFYTHYEDVIKAVKNGDINEDTINLACKRIISWKLRYLYSENVNIGNSTTINNVNTKDKIIGNSSSINEDDIEKINKYYNKSNNNKKLIIVLCVVFGCVGIFSILFIIYIYKKKKTSTPPAAIGQESVGGLPVQVNNNK